jgi:hypothetical protein
MAGLMMNDESERIWKESSHGMIEVLFHHLPAENEENHEIMSQSRMLPLHHSAQ